MGTFFELGKDKAAKGEGWAPPSISCAQVTVELYPPLPLRLLGYGKPLPLTVEIIVFACVSVCGGGGGDGVGGGATFDLPLRALFC